MPPTLGCVFVCASVHQKPCILGFGNFFNIWIPHGKIVDACYFFLSELSPFLKLCPFAKIRMKSDACRIL